MPRWTEGTMRSWLWSSEGVGVPSFASMRGGGGGGSKWRRLSRQNCCFSQRKPMPRVSKQDGGHSSFRIEPVSQSIQVSGECRYDVESNQWLISLFSTLLLSFTLPTPFLAETFLLEHRYRLNSATCAAWYPAVGSSSATIIEYLGCVLIRDWIF